MNSEVRSGACKFADRPQAEYHNKLIDEAAALWESLAQSHPFIDGDKRVAFAATYTFLAINGGAYHRRPRRGVVDKMEASRELEAREAFSSAP